MVVLAVKVVLFDRPNVLLFFIIPVEYRPIRSESSVHDSVNNRITLCQASHKQLTICEIGGKENRGGNDGQVGRHGLVCNSGYGLNFRELKAKLLRSFSWTPPFSREHCSPTSFA